MKTEYRLNLRHINLSTLTDPTCCCIFRSTMGDTERQVVEHASSISELQKVLKVFPSGSSDRGTAGPTQPPAEGIVVDTNYDYVLDMITDVRAEHHAKIDDLGSKVRRRIAVP